MLVTTLRIDRQTYYLSDTVDITGVKGQIVAAVRSGAAFVDFDTLGDGQVSVLMTSQTPVRFETVERIQGEDKEWTDTSPMTDLDLEYLSYGL